MNRRSSITCRGRGLILASIAALALTALGPMAARAATWAVPAGTAALAQAVARAAPGDRLELAAGEHRGGLAIDRPLALIGAPGARLVGPGVGHVLLIDAPDVTVQGLEITGSGLSLESEDSAVFVTKRGLRARIVGNRLIDNLIGVNLKGAVDARVADNVILGRRDLRMNERGNGVQVWNAPGSVIENNKIRFGRDGIFVTTSKRNVFRGNTFRDLRFGIHYMYTNDSRVIDNRSIGNHIGFALMYSSNLVVVGNRSQGDRDHGLLLNYANNARIVGNRIGANPGGDGPKKCVFIYNANKNLIRGNRFQGCGIGIHFTAGSERNQIYGNAFVGNRTQVKYVGTRHLEWSNGARGNYWSDAIQFDLDGDGVAEGVYRPNGLVDQIVWRHPLAKLLLASPAIQILKWAQAAFPALYPGGVQDSHPLMRDPVGAGTGAKEATAHG